jgi:hypothetical protein
MGNPAVFGILPGQENTRFRRTELILSGVERAEVKTQSFDKLRMN